MLMILIAALVHAAQEVGTVLVLEGKATAAGEDNAVRQLAVKGPVYLKGKIETLEGFKIQMQFKNEWISQGERA